MNTAEHNYIKLLISFQYLKKGLFMISGTLCYISRARCHLCHFSCQWYKIRNLL